MVCTKSYFETYILLQFYFLHFSNLHSDSALKEDSFLKGPLFRHIRQKKIQKRLSRQGKMDKRLSRQKKRHSRQKKRLSRQKKRLSRQKK